MKKESLDASKDEQDYQKTLAKKLKEMAKLQEQINALSLDDSREAQAKRAKLLEELAELQEELADTQADKAIDAQKDSLDQMEEDYCAEKDEEIKALEESISSTQKLWDMAIEYIRDHWDTLYRELLDWNTAYGTDLNSDITAAWDLACAAAERYGDFVTAVMSGISSEIDSITRQIEILNEQISNLGTSSSWTSGSGGTGSGGSGGGSGSGGSGSGGNTTVGGVGGHQGPSDEDMVRVIVASMKDLAAQWSERNDKSTNDELHEKAVELAHGLDRYGVHAEYHPDGTWWITRDDLNPENIGKLLYNCYHTGGIVGERPLKPNEQYIRAEKGELMMTARQQDSLVEQLDRIGVMVDIFRRAVMPRPTFSVNGGMTGAERSVVNNITNSSRPIEINIGDTIIQGNASEQTVRQHIKVTRDMMNQIGNFLRRKG